MSAGAHGKHLQGGGDPRSRFLTAAVGLGLNSLLSWGLLPILLLNSRMATLRDYGEVVLWQVMGMVGWPLGIGGAVVGLFFQPPSAAQLPLLFLLIYPTILVLIIVVSRSGGRARWALIALHLLVTASFAAIWHGVLDGYELMVG